MEELERKYNRLKRENRILILFIVICIGIMLYNHYA